jgi:prepilin-type N-terminal cleavage/methylation domain-containing protein
MMQKRGIERLRGRRIRPAGLGEGFTLLEVLAALAILALTASSVLFVVSQNVASVADSTCRMEAFELARENMERILSAASITEMVDFGTSEVYPNISWRTVVEAFSEPAEGTMWLRAVCSADFTDSTGQTQKIELVHWLTPLTDRQAAQFLQNEEGTSALGEQIIEDANGAAKYAGVDVATIQQWLNNGLVVGSDGLFFRHNLDIFVRSKGDPNGTARAQQVHSLEELAEALKNAPANQEEATRTDQESPAGESRGIRPSRGNTGPPGVAPFTRGRLRNSGPGN